MAMPAPAVVTAAIAVDTVLPVKRRMWILTLTICSGCRRARYGQGQGALPCTGLRPSLTSAARADLGVSDRTGGMIGFQSNNGIGKVAEAQAGMATAGSNGLPVFRTPKQSTKSLRMAATTICLGLRRPASLRRATRAATAGLKRIADNAGM